MSDGSAAVTKFELADLGGEAGMDVYELRWELRQRITIQKLIAARSTNALLALTRDHFEFGGADVDFCEALLQRFDIRSTPTPEAAVAREVLGFARLPHDEHERLLHPALADLKTIEDLIAYYGTLAPVEALQKGDTPRNHADSTVIVFYKRCLDERGRIARYLSNEISTKALDNADEGKDFVRAIVGIRFEPPPYPLRGATGIEQYDHRLINRWRHRVRSLPVTLGRELGEKYELDRAGFYSELSKHVPVSKVFEQIFSVLPKVAKLNQRTAVFGEMKTLYEHQHWYGLYALALPHVEGLFTEMLELAGPASLRPSAALTEKVRLVREYAAVHAQNLDYFEFIVPIERNRFSHTGRVEDPQLRATEVLYDLAYVSRVYVELETPVIELLSLLDGGELTSAKSFAPWARLFVLLKEVDKLKQRDQVEAALARLWVMLFGDDTAKRDAIDTLCDALDERVVLLADHLRTITREHGGVEVDILAKRTGEAYDKRQQLREAVSDATATSDTFFDALDVRAILLGMVAECALPDDVQGKVKETLNRLATALGNIEFLSARPNT